MPKIKNHFNTSPEEYVMLRSGHLEERREELIRGHLRCRASEVHDVLELGSGTGSTLASIATSFGDKRFLGIDILPKMIDYAQRTYREPHIRFMLANISTESLDGIYDFAYSIDVLHHVGDYATFLRGVRASLRDGAIWLVIEPNIFNPYIFLKQELMQRAGYDEDHFRPWKLEPALKRGGFSIKLRSYAFMLPGFIAKPPSFLARLERMHENSRILGGSIVYELIAI